MHYYGDPEFDWFLEDYELWYEQQQLLWYELLELDLEPGEDEPQTEEPQN